MNAPALKADFWDCCNLEHLKRPELHDTATGLESLPAGRRKVAAALIGGKTAPTYAEVAELAQVAVGTVHAALAKIRETRPDVWELVEARRKEQLADRHTAAERKAATHSREWHRRQANRRYRERFGCWPWERSR